MELTVNSIKQIEQDMAAQQAAKTVFMAIAWEETIRPVVRAYQAQVLAEINGKNEEGETILDPEHSYQLNDADFKAYMKRTNEERIKEGLHVDNPEFCPLLVAENLTRQAKRALCDVAEQYTGISADQLICTGIKNYYKYIDLLLSLLVSKVNAKMEV